MSIKVENLNFSYKDRKVLSNITCEAKSGKLTSLIGANGVGKSTFFKCILGINQKYTGDIFINGENISHIKRGKLAKTIAYVPQASYSAFSYTVMEMVLMGTTSQIGFGQSPNKKHIQLACDCMEKVGITYLKDRDYSKLSGGERQLTLIARALVQQSKILIMDEPTANMDYGNQMRVTQQIKNLASEGYTIIQSTHNPDQAIMFSDDIIALKNGEVIAEGNAKEVMSPELIQRLYGINVDIQTLNNGKNMVFIPI